MKLTNLDKRTIVKAIMADVPKVDYLEQAQNLIREYNIGRLPKEVQALIGTENEAVLRTTHQYFAGFCLRVIWAPDGDLKIGCPTTERILAELSEANERQNSERDALERKLRAVLAPITTVKKAIEVLPEFEKYFPSEKAPTPNLPATKELVDSFRNAGLKV